MKSCGTIAWSFQKTPRLALRIRSIRSALRSKRRTSKPLLPRPPRKRNPRRRKRPPKSLQQKNPPSPPEKGEEISHVHPALPDHSPANHHGEGTRRKGTAAHRRFRGLRKSHEDAN